MYTSGEEGPIGGFNYLQLLVILLLSFSLPSIYSTGYNAMGEKEKQKNQEL
jgi:hypothetical protein